MLIRFKFSEIFQFENVEPALSASLSRREREVCNYLVDVDFFDDTCGIRRFQRSKRMEHSDSVIIGGW